jgi:hypothetical protein
MAILGDIMRLRITLAIVFLFAAIPSFAQDGNPQRMQELDDIRARIVNYTDTELETMTVNGIELEAPLSRFSSNEAFFVQPGENVVSVTNAAGVSRQTKFVAQAGDIYEIILFDNNGAPMLRAFEYNSLAGSDFNLAQESPWMRVNLFDDVRAINVFYDGIEVMSEIGYGQAGVASAPLDFFTLTVVDADTGATIFEADGGYGEPYYASVSIFDGSWGNGDGEWFLDAYDYLHADPISYLRAISRFKIRDSFTTYLDLVEIAGMTDEIRTMTNVQLYVPDDDALAAISSQIPRDDPEALRQFILGYIVEAEFQVFVNEGEPITLTTLAGTTLNIDNVSGEIFINKGSMYYNYNLLTPQGTLFLGILDNAFVPN